MSVNQNQNEIVEAVEIVEFNEEIGGYMGEELDADDDGNYDREGDDFFDEEYDPAAAKREQEQLAHDELMGEIYNARFYAFD